jgi:hypothetical protein
LHGSQVCVFAVDGNQRCFDSDDATCNSAPSTSVARRPGPDGDS